MKHSILRLACATSSWFFGLACFGCGTDEVQLESMYVSLGLPHPESINADREWGTCLSVFNRVEDTSYEVRLNGRPLRNDRHSREVLHVSGVGSTLFCVSAGDFNLSLVASGKTVAQTGVISMGAGTQYVFLVRGKPLSPTIDVDAIDMSSPGPNLWRLRVSNFLEEQQPVEIFFYDDEDQPRGSTGVIAYGDTFEASISTEVVGWRYAQDQSTARFSPGLGSHRAWDHLCKEKPPAGLVLVRLPKWENDVMKETAINEYSLQRQPVCTVDTTACPPESCGFRGW